MRLPVPVARWHLANDLRASAQGTVSASTSATRTASAHRSGPAYRVRLSSTRSATPPLLSLQNARLRSLDTPLNWSVNDLGSSECWAVIAPASDQGGTLRRELIDILSGRSRPRHHPPPHPFLSSGSTRTAIKHVSFATKMGASSTSGEFTNYAARYGAIRDEDRVTLYERLMDLLDCPVGLVAHQKLLPDPFKTDNEADNVGLFKYKSDSERQAALRKARQADRVIKRIAPLLLITDELLHRPVIALSNGQTRRARILSSLIAGAELVVLEEPFSGIDVSTRARLSDLFAELHAQRKPRLVLVLREQDAVPHCVTHILKINDAGKITSLGPSNAASSSQPSSAPATGPDLIQSNANAGTGIGDASFPALISMNSVSIVYGEKTVLDRIDLSIHPGTRLVLAGDNGSGKTTLLALILGDHPKSFSFPSDSLSLFGQARDHPTNARTLLNRRLGHLSPELFNAFPRRPLSTGGLTVGEVVASGFENVFARRAYTQPQKERVWQLLTLFADLIKSPTGSSLSSDQSSDVKTLSSKGFSELSHGSQALILFLRSVIGNPQLLVLDEPFQGMDRRQVERTRAFIDRPEDFPLGADQSQVEKDLEQRKRIAIVLVSHYEIEWPTTFGRLIRLSDGRIAEQI